MDCDNGIVQRGTDMADDGRNSARCHNSGGVLSPHTDVGHAHDHHGGHWQCHKAWLPGARGRCAGAAGRCLKIALDKNRHTHFTGTPLEVEAVCAVCPIGRVCTGCRGRAAPEHPLGESRCARLQKGGRPCACPAGGLCHASGARRTATVAGVHVAADTQAPATSRGGGAARCGTAGNRIHSAAAR